MSTPDTPSPYRAAARIEAIDLARGFALLAMAVYHFTWDLEFFGYLDPGTTAVGGWKLFARCIASSFLFLVGVSLYLAHGRGIRRGPLLRRLAMVGGAAALISIVTYLAVPQGFIFFGILHQIALASVLGLPFLRLPPLATLVAAAIVIAGPHFLRAQMFDHPALWWLGLAPVNPRSNDYVPVFPWFGAVLIGIAAAKTAVARGWMQRLGALPQAVWQRPFVFCGRHSLAFYLIHQPVLIGLVWIATQVAPPPATRPQDGFVQACRVQCDAVRDAAFCEGYCGCMLESLEADGLLDSLYSGKADDALQSRMEALAASCTESAEMPPSEGGTP
ncbi:MAG: DUF1624 domain-containing protein [Rhizobiaceae bacterium]|nr:DUF1624 domain-containing protein [Rhizobiaceae bacterium]